MTFIKCPCCKKQIYIRVELVPLAQYRQDTLKPFKCDTEDEKGVRN